MYKQNDLVKFEISGIMTGSGRVVGKSREALPILGCGYIIEVLDSHPSLPTAEYAYSHIAVDECCLS
mgnify:CR=1 FL=1